MSAKAKKTSTRHIGAILKPQLQTPEGGCGQLNFTVKTEKSSFKAVVSPGWAENLVSEARVSGVDRLHGVACYYKRVGSKKKLQFDGLVGTPG